MRTCKHRSTCPTAFTSSVHAFKRSKAVLGVDASLARLIEFICKNIQHELAVTVGVDMPVSLLIEESLDLGSVDQIAIVGEALRGDSLGRLAEPLTKREAYDAIWGIDIEWLCLSIGT